MFVVTSINKWNRMKKNAPYTDKSQRGFTLIELMMVVAIVAVIAAISVPSFMNFIQKNKVKSAAEDIYGLVLQGKSEGPVRDSDIFFNLEGSGTAAWCIGFSETASCSCDDADLADVTCRVDIGGVEVAQVIRAENHPDVSFAGTAFSFSQPRISTSNGTLTLALNDWALEIRRTQQGRIKICNPNDNTIPGYGEC